MKRLVYILCILILISCTEKDNSFNDKIIILENSPELLLSQLDTLEISEIRSEEEATAFLLKSLAEYKLEKNKKLDKQKLNTCISIFQNNGNQDKLLYTFILLADIYRMENNVKKEVEEIKNAIIIATTKSDNYWLFYLYNRLSDMYLKQHDFIEFAQYQSIASRYINKLDNPYNNMDIKILIAKNYIHTNHVDKAIQLLESIEKEIKETDPHYPDFRRLFGIAYSFKKDWVHCIKQIETALEYDNNEENQFLYFTILTYSYHKLGDKDKSIQYNKYAMSCKVKHNVSFITSEFCRVSAEIAKENNNIEEEVKYLRWLSSIYYEIINKQNIETMDEIIEVYNNSFEKKQHAQTVKTYHITIIIILLLLIVFLIISHRNKRRKLFQFIELQKRINLLEQIEQENNDLKRSALSLIIKDFEISKQIALLKHTQKEKFERINRELNNLFSVINNNKQLIEWNNFYNYIDISFDSFHKNITTKHPLLNEKEIQLCCMLKAGFKTDEIAAIWQQSIFSVHKYKTNIRKKINAPEGADILKFI
jgi:DNA-binding NarL/FixJ family response regulator